MNYKKYFPFFILFILSILPILDLIHPGFPVTHDGQDHIARIANFYKNLQEGIVIPRWASNLNWGYGHPILMFLYPLPSYSASLFHFFGFSFIDSTKLVFGFFYVLSGVNMYLWLQSFVKKEEALVGSLLYQYVPYRFVDLYVRGAIGEHVAFVFLPLICYFFQRLQKKFTPGNISGAGFACAGLFLSHNAMTLIFFPIIFLYGVYLVIQSKEKRKLSIAYSFTVFLGIGLSAFFLIPAFFEGKYTLRDIVTSNEYASRFVPFQTFFYGPWSYGGTGLFTVQLGIIQWIAVVTSALFVFMFPKKIKPFKQIVFGSLFLLIVSLFLMTSSSLFIWQHITILQKFQFPWRLLSLVVFVTSVCGVASIAVISKKYKTICVILICFGLLLINKNYMHANNYQQKPESFFTSIYNGTTDTGESAPIWSVRFMEHRPKAPLESIDGASSIKQKKRTSNIHTYTITVQKRTRFVENTLYFPGWEVLVDGAKIQPEFQDPRYRGLMTFFVEKGSHTVLVQFKETKLRYFADLITLLTLVSLVIYTILSNRIWQRFQ